MKAKKIRLLEYNTNTYVEFTWQDVQAMSTRNGMTKITLFNGTIYMFPRRDVLEKLGGYCW